MSEREEQESKGLDPDEAPGGDAPRSGEGGHEQSHGTVVDSDASDAVRERAEESD